MWGAIIGGAISALSAAAQHDRARKARNQEADRQREFAQMGVRWRVADARAAGLHPLFALGANTPSYQPDSVKDVDFQQMGQDVSRAAQAAMDTEGRKNLEVAREVSRSQIARNFAEASYFDSLAARARGASGDAAATPFSVSEPVKLEDLSARPLDFSNRVVVKPDEVTSVRAGEPQVSAASHAGEREYTISRFGLKMRLPHSEEGPAEAWNEMSWIEKAAWIRRNVAIYGDGWLGRFYREWLNNRAMPPAERYTGEVAGGRTAVGQIRR